MPKMIGCVIALILLAIVIFPGTADGRSPAGTGLSHVERGWQTSLDAGMLMARESGKPLMVVIRCVP